MRPRMDPETLSHVAIEAAKVTPPAAVAALTFFGYPVADDVQFLMLLYALGIVLHMFWRFARWLRRRGWAE